MKKSRGIRVTILALVLAVAMIMGTSSLSAFAAVPTLPTSSVPFVSSLTYGEPGVNFGDATKVVAPNGEEIPKEQLANFTPLQLGAYTVYIGDEYSYTVPCTLKYNYELRVEHDGADIATYMKAGDKLKIPAAAVWRESEEYGVDYEKVANQKVQYKIIGIDTAAKDLPAEGATREDILDPGTYTVHYFSKIGGEKGTKYLYKDYTVKVQSDFSDTKAPTLNVVNIPKEISLNTKVTLPKATATDDYDKNVKVTITVQQFNDDINDYEPVKEVEIDENGYAKAPAADAADVKFDNAYNLSFYPTKATKYQIKYSAEDDAGNPTSGVHVYTAEAIDKTAPVLKNIDDDLIPTKWAKKVEQKNTESNAENTPAVEVESTAITFPYPEYIDNNSKQLTVIFEIKDTVNANTVIRFSNIYDYKEDEENEGQLVPGTGAKYKPDENIASNGLYPNEATFTKEGLTLDFAPYFKLLEDDGKSFTGTYTVSYQARDVYPNISTKTYDIVFEDTLTDTEAPEAKLTFNDDYLLFTANEEEFTIPTPTVSDDNDTRPSVIYLLSNAEDKKDVEADNCIKVKGGEVAKISLVSNVPTLTIEDKPTGEKKTLKLTGDGLYYYIKATDDAKNVTELTNADKPIRVVNATALSEFGSTDVSISGLSSEKITQGKDATVGGFSITVSKKEDRDFYGFELSLVQGGKLITSAPISFMTYFDGSAIQVKDIKFAVPGEEEAHLYIRVFNVAGASYIVGKAFEVEPTKSGDGTIESGLELPVSGNAYTSYLLKNRKVSTPDDIDTNQGFVVRKVTAVGKFSLMRDTFTAYNAGTFEFTDGYFSNEDGHPFKAFGKNPSYSFTATESATPVWHVQGEMPTYGKADGTTAIVLPKVVASTDYATAKVVLSVVGPDGPLKVAADKDDNTGKKVTINSNGQYEFTPDANKDGTYTVTYTAYYGDGEKLTQSFEIKVGDIVAPTFKLKSDHATRATEGETFVFGEVQVTSTEDLTSTAINNTQYSKRLKAPDGTVVYEVSGTGEDKRTATKPTDGSTYTFNKVGSYTVEYTVTDKAGNEAIKTYTIAVTAKKVNNPISTKIISTILIIVGVLLIAGVILYFIRFRKVKSK